MKCNKCQNENICHDGNHELTRHGCAENGWCCFAPITNADRLRSMTDEELAKFFGTLPCCPPGSAEELCYPENTCGAKMMVKCWGTWLKATVEVDDET